MCIKTLFNLNPFFRSDGYWILSDLTNKPNLFYHATKKIKDLISLFSKSIKPQWNSIDYLLLIYALISYSFISLFLYYVLIINTNSIIYFPKNLYNFLKSSFSSETQFSLAKYAELIVPLIFFMLLFKLLKSFIKINKLKAFLY